MSFLSSNVAPPLPAFEVLLGLLVDEPLLNDPLSAVDSPPTEELVVLGAVTLPVEAEAPGVFPTT